MSIDLDELRVDIARVRACVARAELVPSDLVLGLAYAAETLLEPKPPAVDPDGPLRVYVAAAFAEHPRARVAMARVRAVGAIITHDWTALADEYPDDNAPAALRAVHAREDLDGVRTADAVLVLTPEDRSRGAGLWVEMGAALALGKRLYIAGAQRDRNVFCDLAAGRYETDKEAVVEIVMDELLLLAPEDVLSAEQRARRAMLSGAASQEGSTDA